MSIARLKRGPLDSEAFMLADRQGEPDLFRLRIVPAVQNSEGRLTAGPRLFIPAFGSLADAGIHILWRADVQVGVSRVFRRRLAVLDVLEEVNRLVPHFERMLADLAVG